MIAASLSPVVEEAYITAHLPMLHAQGRERFADFAARHAKQLVSGERSERLADIAEGVHSLPEVLCQCNVNCLHLAVSHTIA